MGYSLICDMLISLFAVYGFYAVVMEISRMILGKEKYHVAIIVESDNDLQKIDSRINAAAAFASYEQRLQPMPVILLSSCFSVNSDKEAEQLLREKGMRTFSEV